MGRLMQIGTQTCPGTGYEFRAIVFWEFTAMLYYRKESVSWAKCQKKTLGRFELRIWTV